ncbi:MAG: signal peptidase II [Bdellovibrionota bacterium]
MKIKYLILAAIAGMIITADQASKMWIHTHLLEGESINVITNFLKISHVHNAGAAFGFLAESHPGFREIFFLSMPPVALLIILAIFRNISDRDRWTITALSSVFGGAIGNYIDRLRFRYVIDFIDFTIVWSPNSNPPKSFVYPSFNIADIAIVCGVAVLLFLEFTRSKEKKSSETPSANPTT